MEDTRHLWMKLATLTPYACISAEYSAAVIRFMRSWLQEIRDSSAAEGYPLCLIDVAIGNLDDEYSKVRRAMESGEWMPDPPAEFHELED